MLAHPPTMFVLAGPNGAGKSTFYRTRLCRITRAEFVNADDLALKAFGHFAITTEESAEGQLLAEERRRELMTHKADFVIETTFSHPSKLDLLRDAKAAGYEIVVYHLNLDSADLAVERVVGRALDGGHPAPEDRIRARYERNQPLIREAVLLADRALVLDSSAMGEAPTPLIGFSGGKVVELAHGLPEWAINLYGGDLP